MSVRLTWIVAFATAVIALPSNAQQHLTRDQALAYAGAANEGFPPEIVTQRVISDSSTLSFYDAILNGRQPWPLTPIRPLCCISSREVVGRGSQALLN